MDNVELALRSFGYGAILTALTLWFSGFWDTVRYFCDWYREYRKNKDKDGDQDES